MKKLSLLVLSVVLSVSLSSCSDDSEERLDRPTGSLSMMVNGVEKSYNNVQVSERQQSNGDIMLTITATQNGTPGEYITFRVKKLATGINQATRWAYSSDSNLAKEQTVDDIEYDMESNITRNTNNRLTGTFEGELYNEYSQAIIEIEDGYVNYNYNITPQQ